MPGKKGPAGVRKQLTTASSTEYIPPAHSRKELSRGIKVRLDGWGARLNRFNREGAFPREWANERTRKWRAFCAGTFKWALVFCRARKARSIRHNTFIASPQLKDDQILLHGF